MAALVLGLSMMFLPLLPRTAEVQADAGFFSGDSDYGSDDSYSGGSYDSDDSYDSGDYSSSRGSGDYSRSRGSGSSKFSFPMAVVIVVGIVLAGIIQRRRDKKRAAAFRDRPAAGTTNLSDLLHRDPAFNLEQLRSKVANYYTDLQNAWQKQDLEPMRVRMTDQMYAQFKHQLDGQIAQGQVSRIERIAVLSVQLIRYRKESSQDCLTFRVKTRINVSVLDRKTGAVVSGNPKIERFMTYEWDMVRPLDAKTAVQTKASAARTCPHCGAAIDEAYSTKCAYCGSIIHGKTYDWVISAIRGIAQQSKR